MLAFYLYPFADNQKPLEYTAEDLRNPSKVEELFDYCQIREGYITKSGWDFLIQNYGYEELYRIDKKSGWLDTESPDEYRLEVETQRELGAILED